MGFDLILYSSKERDLGLKLCGWKFATAGRPGFEETITRLQYEGKFGKSAAIIFFITGDLKKSIEFLNGSRGTTC